ncbi:polymorphic toxin type 15 domain-containing protein [Peribacillus simplex]|uniref:Polymorphic toxin type 15 domain-containing protein n=2 Tax=Peribacillus TaxID=2675229 RepID=A0AA90T5W2_9BACI|nr:MULTISPECIES: T7SS effector LXG polymorphic toxin [Peribacillus]MDP1418081.1 polymorphic toxin type 15 domain-containing protein [Peribacillus simplex]MDP1450957.1 polymorphic toxin type 15 domain-containing protein [Peribacillus frigoritolerans]
MSMIYESQTLVSAMQMRVGQYKDLKEQLTELKKGFESIVHLDDELQGQGAEAIKGFYKAQIDVVDSWLRLINRHIAFLSGIQGDTIEANLSETVVTVPFLEEELTNASRNSKEMVTAQKNDLKKIFAGIDDIIQLEPFSDDAFFENIEKAETKRTETIDKVNEIDHKWTTEYAKSEEDQAAVTALMEQLKVSSTRGGVVSPLYFNATAYKNSEAYKNLEVRKKETAEYLKVKQEEAENRRIKELKAKLDHVTDPDEFLKIAKQIGYENLAPTQQQYVMQLEASKQTADIAKGIGVGLYDVGKDFVTGVWDFVTDPGETVEGVANSIMHPIQTYKYISKPISDSYERDMVNGDAYSRAHWVSYALGTVVTSIVGTKGAGAITKTGVATTKAAAVKGATKAKELVSIPNLLPYNPKNQLSLAGGVPYNVVNGAGLKEQLISMARVESEVSGRGMGTGKDSKEVKDIDTVPRISEIEVNFNYKTKFDSEEFARQLKDQEKGMNELTVYEYQQNRKRFIDEGRAIESNAAQQAAREEAYVQKINELQREGLTLSQAKKEAKGWLDTQAALHNPDQIAGGKAEVIGGMGDKKINSSIGSQWRYRIDIVDEQINGLAKNMTQEQRKNTYLNVKLTN